MVLISYTYQRDFWNNKRLITGWKRTHMVSFDEPNDNGEFPCLIEVIVNGYIPLLIYK